MPKIPDRVAVVEWVTVDDHRARASAARSDRGGQLQGEPLEGQQRAGPGSDTLLPRILYFRVVGKFARERIKNRQGLAIAPLAKEVRRPAKSAFGIALRRA